MIRVIENQSLLDIAMQEEGSVLTVFDLALANGLNVTDNIFPGQKLSLPESTYKNQDVADYFRGKQHLIATNPFEVEALPEIDFDYSFPLGEFPFSF